MPPGVVDAQQAVAGQLHVQVRAGHDQARNVAFFVLLADAANQLASLVVAQHHTVARIGREHVLVAHGQSGEPGLLAGGFPGCHALALAIEHLHVIPQPGVNCPVARHGEASGRARQRNLADTRPFAIHHAHVVSCRDVKAVVRPSGNPVRLGVGTPELADLLVVDEFGVGLSQPSYVVGERVGVLARAGCKPKLC